MPTLRQLTCSIEWGNSGIAFQEHGIKYGDGVVEAFIAIPESSPQPFVVRLTSRGYIAEGLAVIVFIDGEYHANRNRTGLQPMQKSKPKFTEIDFLFRQKEILQDDGSFLGREWRFDGVNIGMCI